jgi:D-methionine transport system permease protein
MSANFIDLLMHSFGETLIMVFAAGICGVVAGVPLGMVLHMERQRTAQERPDTWGGLLARFVVQGVRATPTIVVLVVAMTLIRQLPIAPDGLVAMTFPLALLSTVFIARKSEAALGGVDEGLVEAARSMGAKDSHILRGILLPESGPELISATGLALAALVGYSTLVGAISGNGLGGLGMRYGFHEFLPEAMLVIVALLLVLAEAMQSGAHLLARRFDKR